MHRATRADSRHTHNEASSYQADNHQTQYNAMQCRMGVIGVMPGPINKEDEDKETASNEQVSKQTSEASYSMPSGSSAFWLNAAQCQRSYVHASVGSYSNHHVSRERGTFNCVSNHRNLGFLMRYIFRIKCRLRYVRSVPPCSFALWNDPSQLACGPVHSGINFSTCKLCSVFFLPAGMFRILD